MKLQFFKYQGTGNDFVMLDNREGILSPISKELIAALCNRKKGIGADGVIAIQQHPELDFEMVYWNADGSQSFCGNGSRCAVSFANTLGMIDGDTTKFLSTDGVHEATLLEQAWVSLHMHDVAEIEQGDDYFFINTGSPHYIRYVEDTAAVDVFEDGRAVRYNERFREEGTNVNFVQSTEQGINVRTYERGVEDETLSCGTGVTAAAISAAVTGHVSNGVCKIETLGGQLQVRLTNSNNKEFTNIWLEGPATFVYRGEIDV